jgi:hypothetical protein
VDGLRSVRGGSRRGLRAVVTVHTQLLPLLLQLVQHVHQRVQGPGPLPEDVGV